MDHPIGPLQVGHQVHPLMPSGHLALDDHHPKHKTYCVKTDSDNVNNTPYIHLHNTLIQCIHL